MQLFSAKAAVMSYATSNTSTATPFSLSDIASTKQGTQFRIWATRTPRDHLLRGYTPNEKRLRERGLNEVEQAIDLLSNTLRNQ